LLLNFALCHRVSEEFLRRPPLHRGDRCVMDCGCVLIHPQNRAVKVREHQSRWDLIPIQHKSMLGKIVRSIF
jgi:hypothetical protein